MSGLKTRLLLGTRHVDEYLCCEAFAGFRARVGNVDVTDAHLFLGYAPTLIGLPATFDGPLTFEVHEGSAVVGSIDLEPVELAGTLRIFRGVAGRERLLGYRGAIGQRLLDAVTPRSGPIQLDHEAYAQLRVGYAIARAIRVVTVAAPGGVNRFPTDLHGPVGAAGYVISLRVGSRAGEQVRVAHGLLLAEVAATTAPAVYALGRNHMAEGTADAATGPRSRSLDLPVPNAAEAWLELRLSGVSEPRGVHVLHHFHIVDRADAPTGAPTLFHLHRQAATWRDRHGQATPFVSRR